jgi:RNA recognition motif-containing protein
MGTRLFVGNLPFGATEDEVRGTFERYGSVKDCHIVMDRDTGRSKGFGFVEMSSQDEATKAIEGTNGTELGGRTLNVSEARPRAERGGGGGSRW